MISQQDKDAIVELANKYNVSRLLLFGSSIDLTKESNDIDLAVEGLSEDKFFELYRKYSSYFNRNPIMNLFLRRWYQKIWWWLLKIISYLYLIKIKWKKHLLHELQVKIDHT